MSKQQTAVEWLVKQLKQQGFLYDLDIEAAKQMEIEQIENAYNHGQNNGYMYRDGKIDRIKPEEYYNEIYSEVHHSPSTLTI